MYVSWKIALDVLQYMDHTGFITWCYASAALTIIVCLSVHLSVCLSAFGAPHFDISFSPKIFGIRKLDSQG